MAKEQYKVIGTIISIKGNCDFGHKVGQKFELSGYSAEWPLRLFL